MAVPLIVLIKWNNLFVGLYYDDHNDGTDGTDEMIMDELNVVFARLAGSGVDPV